MEHDLDAANPAELGKILVPDEPGVDGTQVQAIIKKLKEICFRLSNADGHLRGRFPGAHPVSLTREFLMKTLRPQADRYVVCEKTDGIRYLLLLLNKESYLVDRKYTFTRIEHKFPLPRGEKKKGYFHHETLLDGELVVDRLPDGTRKVTYLAYDILAENSVALLDLNLEDRLLAAQSRVISPHIEFKQMKGMSFTFDIALKQMYKCRNVKFVLNYVFPRLRHGNDGLIFTPIDEPYKAGTDEALFKWKPPELNSVDFELSEKRGHYLLNIYDHNTPIFHSWVTLPEHFEDVLAKHPLPCIVECVHDPNIEVFVPDTESWQFQKGTTVTGGWKIIRVRDDKNRPNEKSTLDKIMISIRDRLMKEDLLQHLDVKYDGGTEISAQEMSPPLKRPRVNVTAARRRADRQPTAQSPEEEFTELSNTMGMVFIANTGRVKYFQDINKKWPFWTSLKGGKYLKNLCVKTNVLLQRNMEIIKSRSSNVEEAMKNGRQLYEDKPTWKATRRLGVHGNGEFVTWSQEEYGMPGLQRTYLEMKSFQRFTEMWSLLERAHACDLFRCVRNTMNVRVCSMGGGPGFELLAFQEYFKEKTIGPQTLDIISADLEITWGEYVRLLNFDFIKYDVTACNLLQRCEVSTKGRLDFILVSAVMEMYMSNEKCADDMKMMLTRGGVRAILVVSRSKKLSAHRLMEKRGIRVIPLLPGGDERLSLLLSPELAGQLEQGIERNCDSVIPLFPNVPYLE
jgi:mRNA guanylyltransferase